MAEMGWMLHSRGEGGRYMAEMMVNVTWQR